MWHHETELFFRWFFRQAIPLTGENALLVRCVQLEMFLAQVLTRSSASGSWRIVGS